MRERSVVVYTVAMAASGAGLTAILGSGTSDTVLADELHQVRDRLLEAVAFVEERSKGRRCGHALPGFDLAPVAILVDAAATR